MTCSESVVSVPKNWSTFGSCSSVCGTGASRVGKGAKSTICCTVRRCTQSCGLTPARRSGRDPAAGTSSTSREKCSVPAALGVGCSGTWPCSTARSHSPLLALLCHRVAAWCSYVARSICSVSCSCRQCARSLRWRRLHAAPRACATSTFAHIQAPVRLTRKRKVDL